MLHLPKIFTAVVSRPRRLARPTGLPRSLQPQVSEVFVLAKLTPNEGDLSVKHLGGVRRPAPSAGAFQGGVQPKNCATSKSVSEGIAKGESSLPSVFSCDFSSAIDLEDVRRHRPTSIMAFVCSKPARGPESKSRVMFTGPPGCDSGTRTEAGQNVPHEKPE